MGGGSLSSSSLGSCRRTGSGVGLHGSREICDEVLGRFDPDRESHQIFGELPRGAHLQTNKTKPKRNQQLTRYQVWTKLQTRLGWSVLLAEIIARSVANCFFFSVCKSFAPLFILRHPWDFKATTSPKGSFVLRIIVQYHVILQV